ncbi:MAG: hypothetical protein ACLTCB_02235 [Merdibacter sp.]
MALLEMPMLLQQLRQQQEELDKTGQRLRQLTQLQAQLKQQESRHQESFVRYQQAQQQLPQKEQHYDAQAGNSRASLKKASHAQCAVLCIILIRHVERQRSDA